MQTKADMLLPIGAIPGSLLKAQDFIPYPLSLAETSYPLVDCC